MKSVSKALIFLILLSLFLTACNLPTSKTVAPTADSGVALTAAASTVSALITQQAAGTATAQAAIPPTATGTPLPPTDTPSPATAMPTNTLPAATSTLVSFQPTSTPLRLACNRADFVIDVTIPDNTLIDPGKKFTKTWRIVNKGSCKWSTSYKLIFDNGNAMSGPATVNLPKEVRPGETVDVSVDLVAPEAAGAFQGHWKMQDADGNKFGFGDDAASTIWVKIVTGATPTMFAVMTIGMSASPATYSGVCPVTITFTGAMKVSKAGTVTYHWEYSDGSKGSEQSLVFGEASTKNVTSTWTVGGAGQTVNGYAKIWVNNPNHQYFSDAPFTVTCNP